MDIGLDSTIRRIRMTVENVALWYAAQSGTLRTVVIPILLAALNMAAVKLIDLSTFFSAEPVTATSVFAFCIFIVANTFTALVTFANTEDLKTVQLQNDRLFFQLIALDKAVLEKNIKLTDALSGFDEERPDDFLISLRDTLQYEKCVSKLNECLFDSLEFSLRNSGWLKKESGCHLAFLSPDSNGEFCIVGTPYASRNSPRRVARNTGIYLEDDRFMVSRLWKRTNTSIMCSSDTSKSEQDGEFRYLSKSERGVLRSIFMFRVDNRNTGEPLGVFSVDANSVATFPDRDNVPRIAELEGIFRSYESRLQLEWTYNQISKKTESLYQ